MEPKYTLQPTFSEEDSIDFKHYLALFISNWYWFTVALFISISIAYGINRWSEEIFIVKSTLLIKDNNLSGSNNGFTNIFPGSDVFNNQQNIKNEIGILKSFSVNYRVMQELKDFHVVVVKVGKRGIAESRQYRNSPFVIKYDTIINQSIEKVVGIRILSEKEYQLEINGEDKLIDTLAFGERFREMGFDFIIDERNAEEIIYDPAGSNKFFFYFISTVSLANNYRGKLTIIPIEEEASLLELSSTGFVSEQEADYLNKLMEVYRRQGLELKNETAENTISFIDEQLGLISDSLSLAEDRLEKFRLLNKLVDLSREGAIIMDRLDMIENERISLLLQKNYYRYLIDYIGSKNKILDIVSPSVMGVTDQLLIQFVSELADLQQQKEQMIMTLNDNSEPIKILEARIQNIKSVISENINSAWININRSIEDVSIRLENVEDEIRRLPTIERQMINIQREFDINNTVYTFLLEKRAEAGITRASNVSDSRVIDYAEPFNRSRIRPRERQNLIFAIVLGLLIPIISIVSIDYLNNKIINKKDIERGTGAPIVGFISHNNYKTEIPVAEQPRSTLSESFRSVRTNLRYFLKDKTCPVISVSSTISSEGKTFISANLAIILASLNKKVLLVGLDLRKPRAHKILGIDNEIGLSNYLIGEIAFDEVVVKTHVANLWYATSGIAPPNPAELIESKEMKVFIDHAKEQYDYIIIDTPPVAIVTDALLVSPLTDFYLFVVRQRYTSKNILGLIDDLHKNENIKSIGIILNDISISGYYGYGLRYGYAMSYGYSYGYNYYSQGGYPGYGSSLIAKGYYDNDE